MERAAGKRSRRRVASSEQALLADGLAAAGEREPVHGLGLRVDRRDDVAVPGREGGVADATLVGERARVVVVGEDVDVRARPETLLCVPSGRLAEREDGDRVSARIEDD